MSQPAKPKSSTSEATMTKPKIQKIIRCSDSEEEENAEVLISGPIKSKPSASESAKPKANITKKRVAPTPADSDDEDDETGSQSEEEEEEEDDHDQEASEDDQTNIKRPAKAISSANNKKPVKTVKPVKAVKKQASSKESSKKRARDSDDEVVHHTTKPKKPKSKAAGPLSRKKHPIQVIHSEEESEDDSEDDSEDEIIELTKKSTKPKPKTTQKQPIKPSKFTPTKKRQIFQTSTDPESEDEPAEETDSSAEEDLPKITLTERIGDLFTAPPDFLLVHACNCVGSWNAGVALAFQKKYPQAYSVYQAHCAARTPNSLLSTCLIIPPQSGAQYNHWIGCLFTSRKYGRGKDSKEDILESTDSALQDMLEQLEELKKKPKGVWMCKINSGSFKIPWMQTKKLIEALTFKGGLHIEIVDKK